MRRPDLPAWAVVSGRSFFSFPAGRRSKWVVFTIWIVAIFVAFGANLPGKFSDAEDNESTSFLPGDAESTKALTATEDLQGGELAPAVIVFRRDSGLTAADRQQIQRDIAKLSQKRFPGVVADGATAAAGGKQASGGGEGPSGASSGAQGNAPPGSANQPEGCGGPTTTVPG